MDQNAAAVVATAANIVLSSNSNNGNNKAVCIVSGGLDSICTASLLKKRNYELYLITFMYGQRSRQEIDKAKEFAKILKVKDHRIIDIKFMKHLYGKTNVLTYNAKKSKLPEKFQYDIVVPIRNAVFITIASAWALSIGAKLVAYGAHTGDNKYPDCRPIFAKSITKTLNLAEDDGIKLGLRKKIQIWSPASDDLDKSELLRIGYEILGEKIFNTWSCYSNGINTRKKNAGGSNNNTNKIRHCGICESCINRRQSIINAGIKDRTDYAK